LLDKVLKTEIRRRLVRINFLKLNILKYPLKKHCSFRVPVMNNINPLKVHCPEQDLKMQTNNTISKAAIDIRVLVNLPHELSGSKFYNEGK